MASRSVPDLVAVEEAMAEVRRNWSVMLQEGFNPIPVALDMLQKGSGGSGLGQDFEAFQLLHGRMEDAMGTIVERYYTGFNDAVNIFGGIVENMRSAHGTLGAVRKDVVDFRDHVQYKRAELPELWATVQHHRGVIAAARKMEGIARQQRASRDLAARRFFIPAARTLMDAMYDARYLRGTVAKDSELHGPLGETSKALDTDRDGLFDRVLDEAQRVLYFRDEAHGQQLFARLLEAVPEVADAGALRRTESAPPDPALALVDADLVLAPSEFEFRPDLNGIAYLRSLVRAAATLELLPHLLQLVTQKMAGELHGLTSRVLQEAARDYAAARASAVASTRRRATTAVTAEPFSREHGAELRAFLPVLAQTCERYFSELLTVAAGMRILADAVAEIAVLNDAQSASSAPPSSSSNSAQSTPSATPSVASSTVSAVRSGTVADVPSFLANVAGAIRAEVRAFCKCLLHGTDGRSADGAARNASAELIAITESLGTGLTLGRTDGTGTKPRATEKRHRPAIYAFSFVDAEVAVPPAVLTTGPVQDGDEEAASRKLASLLVLDPFAPGAKERDHVSPVTPSIHMLPVLWPTHTLFAERLCRALGIVQSDDVVAVDERYLRAVLLDEFVPSVRDTVSSALGAAFDAPDALLWVPLVRDGSASAEASAPSPASLLVCVARALSLVLHVLRILHCIPEGRDALEDVLSSLLAAVVERCEAKLRETLRGAVSPKFAREPSIADLYAILLGPADPISTPLMDANGSPLLSTAPHGSPALRNANRSPVLSSGSPVLGSTHGTPTLSNANGSPALSCARPGEEARRLLATKEMLLLDKLKADRSLHATEVVFDERGLRTLLLVVRSLTLALPVLEGRIVLDDASALPIVTHDGTRLHTERFDGLALSDVPLSPAFEVQYLRFSDAVAGLARTCLYAARIEARVHAYYFVDLAFREGSYDGPAPSDHRAEPDTYIVALAADLARLDALAAAWLSPAQHSAVVSELSVALDAMLVAGLRCVRRLGAHGPAKLRANVAALEQLLARLGGSSAVGACRLRRAREYFALAAAGPQRLSEVCAASGFTLQECTAILDAYHRDDADRNAYNNAASKLRHAFNVASP